ncbi:MFS transporter [Neobacillus sp. D3-1R]|uniref:MFS transporter n=1 Tax=Neobacillus sp. D3-1R TaxID=3445778 RepID=UPI003FA16D8D
MKKYVFVVGFSEFASRMNFMALSVLLLSFQNAEWYLMAFFLVRQIGGIITSFIAGSFIDRVDRRKLMILTDGINVLSVLLPIFYYHPISICMAAFILGCTNQLFYISYSASIPDMFGHLEAPKINALIVRVGSIVSICGFIIGGWTTEFFGHKPVILFDSLTFLIAAIYLVSLRWDSVPKIQEHFGDRKKLFSVMKKGPVAIIVVTSLFYTFAVSANNYSLPFLASTFKLEALTNGLFWATASAGMLVGTILINKKDSFIRYCLFLFFFSAAMILVFRETSQEWILIFLFVSGVFEGLSQVTVNTILQKTSVHERGKAFSLQGLFSRIGFFVGFLICPLIVQHTSLAINVNLLNGALMVWISLILIYVFLGNRHREIRRMN